MGMLAYSTLRAFEKRPTNTLISVVTIAASDPCFGKTLACHHSERLFLTRRNVSLLPTAEVRGYRGLPVKTTYLSAYHVSNTPTYEGWSD